MTEYDGPIPDESGTQRIEALLRETTSEDGELLALPDDLWSGIQAELDKDETNEPSNVVDLGQRRRLSPRLALSAAAALLVIVGGIAVATQRDETQPTVVASADLTYDPVSFDDLGANADARVSLVDDDGALRVEIDESDLPDPGEEAADLELWLIAPDADGNPADLVSLGLIDLDDPRGFEVPAAYDPEVFFVVDISVEPRDGNADHSGRSILRGPLTEI